MAVFTMKSNALAMVVLAVMLVGLESSAGEKPTRQPMNVLFLVADDMNSWLLEDPDRYAGKVLAPNLHRLARSGVNFTRAYTAAPVCSPLRTAFFSGVAPWKSGHYHNS